MDRLMFSSWIRGSIQVHADPSALVPCIERFFAARGLHRPVTTAGPAPTSSSMTFNSNGGGQQQQRPQMALAMGQRRKRGPGTTTTIVVEDAFMVGAIGEEELEWKKRRRGRGEEEAAKQQRQLIAQMYGTEVQVGGNFKHWFPIPEDNSLTMPIATGWNGQRELVSVVNPQPQLFHFHPPTTTTAEDGGFGSVAAVEHPTAVDQNKQQQPQQNEDCWTCAEPIGRWLFWAWRLLTDFCMPVTQNQTKFLTDFQFVSMLVSGLDSTH
jgi:hypothetical protein